MESVIIWTIGINTDDSSVELELFAGRNKYTKKGLFSGPLHREDIINFSDNQIFQFLLSLDDITQTKKNKFILRRDEALLLFDHFRLISLETAYCRLSDKKLHHVNKFVLETNEKECKNISYESRTGFLFYPSPARISSSKETIITTPKANLFLHQEGKSVRGYLTFSYWGIEIQANFAQETIQLSTRTVFRNLRYERLIQEKLYSFCGRQSFRNEILFPLKDFFSHTLPILCKQEINLYWGKEKQIISKSLISCNISYDMDWFSISGEVKGENTSYLLSDLLKLSKGKAYVEIDNGILFLPEELREISAYPEDNGRIQIRANRLAKVNAVAERFNIDSSLYLNKFLDFSLCSYTLDPMLNMVLKPYQKAGVAWILTLYKNKFGGCLADDMGLGKTIQAIAFICCHERNSELPVLIVVPKIVLFNWKNELIRFAMGRKFVIAYGDFDYTQIHEKNTICITTYDTLVNKKSDFSDVHFDTLILDESQFVKNFRTKRYRAIKNINADFLLALTGTPIENNIEELWSLLNLLNPGLFGNHKAFMKKYGNAHTDPRQISLLRNMISPFVMRRTKEQVLQELPTKTEEYIFCEMEENQRALYDTLLVSAQNEIRAKPSRYTIKDNAAILQALLYLREVCSAPQLLPPSLRGSMPSDSCKFELFKEYSNRIMEGTGKIIVYSLFPRVLKSMEKWCSQKGWHTFYIDGTVNHRQRIVDEFEKSDEGVFFISLKAGGVGLNLVSCQYVIIFDPWWNSAAEQQAANRVHRIGQEKPVFIYHFLVKDSIEEKIYELQQKKEKLSTDVLERLDSFEKLSIDDYYKLLF